VDLKYLTQDIPQGENVFSGRVSKWTEGVSRSFEGKHGGMALGRLMQRVFIFTFYSYMLSVLHQLGWAMVHPEKFKN